MREADEPSTWVYALCRYHIECCARPTGDRHGLTTRALKLLMSIGIPLENTKRPEPRRAPTRLVQRSGRDGGGRPRPE
jgi:hypothetical protein